MTKFLLLILISLTQITPAFPIENGVATTNAPVVGLIFKDTFGIFCSGALIEARIVVSAHHCIPTAGADPDIHLKYPIQVAAPGKQISDQKTERANVISIVSNKSMWKIGDCAAGFCDDLDDVMYLILDRDFEVPANLKIATKDDIFRFRAIKAPVVTYGYGNNRSKGHTQDLPLQLNANLDSPDPGGYGELAFNISVSGNQNVCAGDSGGPTYVLDSGYLYYLGPTSGTRRPSCISDPILDHGYFGGTAIAFKPALLNEALLVSRKLRAEAEAKAKLEAEAKAKLEAEAKAKLEAEAKAKLEVIQVQTSKKVTIYCLKGKITKKVTSINPKCPLGYKKK